MHPTKIIEKIPNFSSANDIREVEERPQKDIFHCIYSWNQRAYLHYRLPHRNSSFASPETPIVESPALCHKLPDLKWTPFTEKAILFHMPVQFFLLLPKKRITRQLQRGTAWLQNTLLSSELCSCLIPPCLATFRECLVGKVHTEPVEVWCCKASTRLIGPEISPCLVQMSKHRHLM